MNFTKRLFFYNLRTPIKNSFYECRRHLLSASSLGIDRFIEAKKQANNNAVDKGRFLKEMEDASQINNDTLIFTNDIRKVVMLVSEDNLEILPKLLKKLSLQNETIKFQKYVYGPDIMKLYYLFNKPLEALTLIQDKDTAKHFYQITSFTVLADMLFNNGMFEDVIFVCQYFYSKANIHRDVQALILLFLGACCKLNTLNSMEKALNLWKSLHRKGFKFHKRGLAFLGLLSVKQNKPQIAVEVLNGLRPDPVVLNIKVLALVKSKRFDDALQMLEDALLTGNEMFVTVDVISTLKNDIAIDKVEYIPKFNHILSEFMNKNLVNNEDLDDIAFRETDVKLIHKKLSN